MISIVCPVYNEAENIGALLEELKACVSVSFELLIVHDQDEDTTIPVIQRLSADFAFPIRLVKNRLGRGPLKAIRTGFLEAKNEAVLVIMADLSDDLRIIDEMYRLLKFEGFDIICGSRYMRGGRQIGGPLVKGLLSRLAGVSLHHLAGVPTHDVTNSFKMYKLELLNEVQIESDAGFEVGIELVVKSHFAGKRIAEIPATWTDRVAGQSRFKLMKWLPKYLRWYLYAFRACLFGPSSKEVVLRRREAEVQTPAE